MKPDMLYRVGQQTKEEELKNCTFVKTVLMLLVLFYHSILFWNGNWFTRNPVFSSSIFPLVAEWLNSFHIYGFVLVSGYLFYYAKYERGKYQVAREFIVNKTQRLLIPYSFVAAAWVMPITALFFPIKKEFFTNFLLGIAPAQLWFLPMLFIVFLIAYRLSDVMCKSIVCAAVLCLAFYAGGGILASHWLPNVFQIWTACKYLIFFGIGMKIRQLDMKLFYQIPTWLWIVTDIGLFLILKLIEPLQTLWIRAICQGLTLLLHVVGAMMSFFILQKIAKRLDVSHYGIMTKLGCHSMTIYLFHQQFIYLSIAWLNGKINPYLHAFINAAIGLSGSYLLSILLRQFPITRFLIGEKTLKKPDRI